MSFGLHLGIVTLVVCGDLVCVAVCLLALRCRLVVALIVYLWADHKMHEFSVCGTTFMFSLFVLLFMVCCNCLVLVFYCVVCLRD